MMSLYNKTLDHEKNHVPKDEPCTNILLLY